MNDRDESLRRARETMRRLQHEVRTPIGQIIGYAELLEEELEDYGAGELSADLQKIRDAASRLLDLVDGKLRDEQDPGAPVLPEQGEAPSQEEGSESAALDAERPVRVLVVGRGRQRPRAAGAAPRAPRLHGGDGARRHRGVAADRRGRPDVVLLEVMMSGMGGLEVLERVRRQRFARGASHHPGHGPRRLPGRRRGAGARRQRLRHQALRFSRVIARVQSQLEAHRTARQVAELARQLEFRSTFIREALGRDVSDDLLVAMAEQPDVLDLGRERRRVVAVVADVRGSRQRAATLEPAQETGVLKNVLDGLSAVVTHHGGVVEDVSGDSLVALFGLPLGAADDAERAAACALAMQLEMDEINDRGARVQLPAVEIGVGVASGDVAVVSLGTGDQVNYKAVGEPPLHATALEAQARGGEVWICAPDAGASGGAGQRGPGARGARRRSGPDGPALRAHRLLGLGGSRLISLRSIPRD